MAPASSKDAAAVGKRPSPLRLTSSGRTEAAASTTVTTSTSTLNSSVFKPPPPKRASTAPHTTPTKTKDTSRQKQTNKVASGNEKNAAAAAAAKAQGADTFDTQEDNDDPPEPPRASVDMEDLPIELIGLTDNFIESLSAKVHPTPPNIDSLSRKFQDFYATSSTHIGTHIAALAMRQNRERSPAPTNTTRASAASIFRAKAASISGRESKTPPPPPKTDTEQQMITSEELANRKRARRALEQKRSLLEEAVERRLCEGIYDRIYRHRTTQDEAQDDKLRSKTAALDVVGIGPADLGVDLGEPADADPITVATKQKEVREWLEPARKEIALMGQTHYPLGKLNRLKSAHKAIVDTLSHFHPSSSADEIMPMLIYTLITLPPQELNVISDLNFIQRFRWEQKIEGEAAYCLTNLEASISFLDTVDLSTLRADEAPSGPLKTLGPETPKTETFPPYFEQNITVSAATPSTPELSPSQATATAITKPAPSPTSGLRAAVQLRNRRLSDLVNTPAQALGAAGGAVINTFNAADHGFKTIGSSLEGSYRLFVGRMSQQQHAAADSGTGSAGGVDGTGKDVLLPKTLDEARKLIATPPPGGSEDEASVNGDEHPAGPTTLHQTPHITPPRNTPTPPIGAKDRRVTVSREERLLSLMGGRKASVSRDPSADSARSAASSSRRVAFADDESTAGSTASTSVSGTVATGVAAGTATAAATAAAGINNPALMDSMRNLGSSLNPMSRLGGFRGFGRAASTPAVATTADKPADGGDLATAFPDIAGALPPKPHIAPPVKRFMELHNPADLRISEVLELLRDYRRLATALKDMGAFEK